MQPAKIVPSPEKITFKIAQTIATRPLSLGTSVRSPQSSESAVLTLYTVYLPNSKPLLLKSLANYSFELAAILQLTI